MRFLDWVFKGAGASDPVGQLPEILRKAGLDEETLRRMDPDDRVAALEGANLDPYDFIYLAC